MNWISELRWYLAVIQIGTFPILLTKLLRSGLYQTYRCFTWFVAFEAIRVPLMWLIPYRSPTYAHVYFATQPILWLLYALVVLELFQLVLQNHPGIASLGRKVLTWALAISASVSGATLMFQLQEKSTESAILFNFALLERLVTTSLLILLLCLIAFLMYFPVPLSRNVRVHALIFATYFTARTVVFGFRTWFGEQVTPVVNLIMLALAVGCIISWTFLLTRAGEVLATRRRPAPETETRLLAQLSAINDTLLRSSKK